MVERSRNHNCNLINTPKKLQQLIIGVFFEN